MSTQYSDFLPLSHKRKEESRTLFNRECAVFCRYLLGTKPTEYVMRKYEEAHKLGCVDDGMTSDPFDRTLTALAKISPVATRIVDSYAAVFFHNCLLRRKLILLLAILESCAPSHSSLDTVDEGPRSLIAVKLVQSACASGFLLLIAILMFVPLHAMLGTAGAVFERTITLWKQ